MIKSNLKISQPFLDLTEPLTCQNCGYEIEIEDAYQAKIEKKLENELKKAKSEIQAKSIEKAKLESSKELLALKSKLKENEDALETSQKSEAALLAKSNQLTIKEKNLELEISRKVNEQLGTKIEESQNKSKHFYKEQLEMLEKKYSLKEYSLRKKLEDAQTKLSQGSQQIQGETLELLLEEKLERLFPLDKFEEVKKGKSGADLIQNIYDKQGSFAGKILWEFKNTKHWSDSWVDKLKKDQQNSKIEIAVIVSNTLPKDVNHFTEIKNIWVASRESFSSLALVLRAQLIQVHKLKQANTGKDLKTERVYEYLSGPHFKQRIESIIEAFQTMQQDLHKEKTFLLKNIAKREKQLENVLHGTAGMYGDLESLLGQNLVKVSGLEIEEDDDENEKNLLLE